jgi:hypothetical protein
MFSFTTAIILFLTYTVIDMLYAAYILYVNRLQACKAATCSMIIYCLLAYGVVSYSTNIWYIIPLAMGAWLGSFITVMYEKRKKKGLK